MNIELATLMDHFYKLMWPMLRISALLMTAPIFSLNALNLRIRILFGLALTIMVYPLTTGRSSTPCRAWACWRWPTKSPSVC